ncbi:DUF1080 domain-containing protein [Sphingobacterium sp. SG20118]|uniref:3-keto-disaccharide hydrolase n=1 Tax=Sphingobacterium sp. SG20118 TaxID=3367156 RepID=UPI0037DFC7EF
MKRNFLMAIGCSMLLFASPIFAQKKSQNTFTPLFDGKTFEGWRVLGGNAKYSIEDGVIVGEMTKGTPNSFLATDKEYGDFILELEFKIEGTETNSGVQIRSHIDPQGNKGRGRVFGKQVEIDPSERAWCGGLYEEGTDRSWIYPLGLYEPAQKAFKADQFNKLRIEAIGDEVRVWMNDQPTAAVIDTIDRKGIIALQVHSIPERLNGKKVYFKNINIKTEALSFTKLPKDMFIVNLKKNNLSPDEKKSGVKLLFNGVNNKGWRSIDAAHFPKKGWQVKDGEIMVLKSDGGEATNGRDIITEKQYRAFDLSFEFQLTPGANSGVKYFVTLKEQTKGSAIGLEYQILDNEKHPDAKMGKDGNRTMASLYDLITSSRDGRAPREIGEWNRGRIVVTPDNQVTHYLNGIKMLTYKRGSADFKKIVSGSKYKDWPNFGEAEKGHILLQDHGDAVRFRSIKIKELK